MPKRFLITLAAALLLAGCSDKPSQVSGVVTLDDQPLTKGTVAFYPQEAGQIAYGQIGGNGRYSLSTGTDDGLVPGSYTVTVEATELVPATPQNPEPLPKLLTPEKYRDKASSGIVVEVKPGSNSIPLELKSN